MKSSDEVVCFLVNTQLQVLGVKITENKFLSRYYLTLLLIFYFPWPLFISKEHLFKAKSKKPKNLKNYFYAKDINKMLNITLFRNNNCSMFCKISLVCFVGQSLSIESFMNVRGRLHSAVIIAVILSPWKTIRGW